MREPRWISKAVVLAIHERLIAEHGGAPGPVDEGRLEAALSSPRNQFHYEKLGLFSLAAAYAHALTRDHPFRDGNKRVALTVAGVFLELNGYRLVAPEHEAVAATVALSSRKLDMIGYAAWLRSSCAAVPGRKKKRRRRKPG